MNLLIEIKVHELSFAKLCFDFFISSFWKTTNKQNFTNSQQFVRNNGKQNLQTKLIQQFHLL